MKHVKAFFKSVTPFEYCLWGGSVIAIVLSFVLCDSKDYVNLAGALIGASGLIFLAKGNVVGNFLCVAFAVFYGVISYFTRYYGEMITYLGMTAPTAIVAIVTWLRHPFSGKKTQVQINRLSKKEYALSFLLSCAVAVAFYFILGALNTANLILSTVSVLTSFYASYLTIRRSPFYALAYCANDGILIALWSLMAVGQSEYVCMVVCFAAFFLNDLYGFFNWLRMHKQQSAEIKNKDEPENKNESAPE